MSEENGGPIAAVRGGSTFSLAPALCVNRRITRVCLCVMTNEHRLLSY